MPRTKHILTLVAGLLAVIVVAGGSYYAGYSKGTPEADKQRPGQPVQQSESPVPGEVALATLTKDPAKYFNKTVVVRGVIYGNKEGEKTNYTLIESQPTQKAPAGISVSFDGFKGNVSDFVTVLPTPQAQRSGDAKDSHEDDQFQLKVVIITGTVVQTSSPNGQPTLALRAVSITRP